jgi:hypothetical protein
MVDFHRILDHGCWIGDTGTLHQWYGQVSNVQQTMLTVYSWHVCSCQINHRLRHPILYHRRLIADGRTRLPKGTTHHDISIQRIVVCRLFDSRGHFLRYTESKGRLGLANPLYSSELPLADPDCLHLVSTRWRILLMDRQN